MGLHSVLAHVRLVSAHSGCITHYAKGCRCLEDEMNDLPEITWIIFLFTTYFSALALATLERNRIAWTVFFFTLVGARVVLKARQIAPWAECPFIYCGEIFASFVLNQL